MKPTTSFRTILLIRFILAAFLPVLLVGTFTYVYVKRQITQEVEQKNQVIAKAVSGQISSILKEPVDSLYHTQFLINTFAHTPEKTQAVLDQTLSHASFFEVLYILDRDKEIISLGMNQKYRYQKDLVGLDMSGMELFKTPFSKGHLWSHTYLSPLSGRKSLDLALTLKQGKILVGSFNISHIHLMLKKLSHQNSLGFFVSDNKGNLIFHPKENLVSQHMNYSNLLPLQEAFKGNYGTFPFTMGDQDFIGSTAGIKDLNWHIVVAQTREEAVQPLREIQLYFGIALICALLLVSLLAVNTATGLIRPMKNFQTSMGEMEKGRYETELPGQEMTELEDLALLFRKMATAINSREKALQISEEKFRSIFENAPLAVIHYDKNGIVKTCNENAIKVFGAPRKAIIGFNGLNNKSNPGLAQATAAALNGEESQFTYEHRPSFKSRPIIFNANFGPVHLDGEVAGAIGIFEDITTQKEMEKRTQKSEEKFKVIFEQANDAILVADLESGRIILGNQQLSNMLDIRQDELIGMDIQSLFPSSSDRLKMAADKGETDQNHSYLFEQPMTKQDGSQVMTEVNAARIEVGGKDHFIGFFRDISQRIEAEKEKKSLESQLRQAHKMEAIGTLAGGIAHDFNNLLGIILGNLELALDDLPKWTPVKQNLDEIKTAGFRAKDVVRQLLSFSRKAEQERTPVQMAQLLEESVGLLRASIPTSIDIQTRVEPDISPVNADPTQIQQIIINLCTNSAHAMPEARGKIRLALTQIHLSQMTFKGFGTLEAGTYVSLSVADNGHGIDPKVVDRVFDPYFTTKEVGKGTGMGLAVVHGIVVNHDGALSLYSEPDKGTEIRIYLPAVESRPIVKPELDHDIPRGEGQILLVDDEASLVRATMESLEKLGYTIIPATSPESALSLFRENPQGFDLVLTDMTMPGMTGEILAKEITRLRPEIPVILCTGFSHQLNPSAPLPQGVKQILEKPMNRRTLAKAIHSLLVNPAQR